MAAISVDVRYGTKWDQDQRRERERERQEGNGEFGAVKVRSTFSSKDEL